MKKKTMNDLEQVRQAIERSSQYYYHTDIQQGIDNRLRKLLIERCQMHIKGTSILNLGYIDGTWTDSILSTTIQLDIVEGAQKHIQHAQEKYQSYPNVRMYHQLFQEFQPDCQYDTIIAGDILRFIPDDQAFLQELKKWLTPDGTLIVTVPNSRSLHRRIGAWMKLESSPSAPNQHDKILGNYRSYDRYELRELLLKSDYNIQHLHGCLLKPLSSEQMKDWNDSLLQALLHVGDELEDYCWFLYAICQGN